MISLRRSVLTFCVPLIGLLVASCSDGAVGPGQLFAPAAANRDGKVGSTGNSAKSGSIDVRVLLDSKGAATVEFRTGTYDDATGLPLKPATADGYFTKIQYKVNNAAGKQILVRNITFNKTAVGYYSEPLNLCASSDENDDDDDRRLACSTKYDKGYTVVTQANLKGVGGDGNATDVVRDENAPEFSLGDVKLSDQPIYLLSGTTRTSLASASVPLGLQTYQVDFPNLTAPAPAAGVQTQCLVYLDGSWLPQLPSFGSYVNPNGFEYVGNSSPFVGGGHTETCTFKLNVTGSHKIVVTALPLLPGDYNPLNNSTASFTIAPHATTGPLDLTLGAIQRFVGTESAIVTLDTVSAGVNGTFKVPVTATGVIPNGTTDVICTVTVVKPGSTASTTMSVSARLTAATPVGACLFAFPFDVVGAYTVNVSASDTDEAAAQSGNNAAPVRTFQASLAPPSADLYVSAVTETVAGGSFAFAKNPTTGVFAAPNAVHVLAPTNYEATISLQNGNVGSSDVTVLCTVQNARGTVVGTHTVHVSSLGSAACAFTDTPASAGTQTFTITLSNASVSDPANNTATATVLASLLADVKVTILDQTATLGKSTQVTMSVQNLEPAGGTPSTVVCGLTWSLPAPAVMPAGAVAQSPNPTITVAGGATQTCSFNVTFTLAAGSIGVAAPTAIANATPTTGSAQDDAMANNTATATVTTNTGGAFTNSVAAMSTSQQWTVPGTGTLKVVGLQTQEVKVDRLALLVLPVADTLGFFELTGTISSAATINSADITQPLGPGITFESGKASGSVPRDQCLSPGGVVADQAHPQNSVPAHVSVSAAICARAADQSMYPGMQEIVVSYTRTLPTDAAIGGPDGTAVLADPLWAKQVSVAILLRYRLASQPNAPFTVVTATVTFNLKDPVHGDTFYANIWNTDAPFTTSVKSP
jgi:hypothetical protein